MNNIYSQLTKSTQKKSQPRLSKEEFAKEMQQRRQYLFDMAEKQSYEAVSSSEKYKQFLDLLWRTDYTVTNALLIMAQKPDSVMLKDSSHWRDKHLYIKKGEKGIQILEPSGEYERGDGTIGTSYNPKYVFDVSQINTKDILYHEPEMNVENIVTGLTYDSPVKLNMLENMYGNVQVLYSPESKSIFYSPGLEPDVLLQGLVREYCHVEFDRQYNSYNRETCRFFVESSAYIVCRKYGINTNDQQFMNETADYFYGMDSKEIKKELSQIKELSRDVSARIDRGIYKTQQSKNAERNQEVR